jgi:hypothetical protein
LFSQKKTIMPITKRGKVIYTTPRRKKSTRAHNAG